MLHHLPQLSPLGQRNTNASYFQHQLVALVLLHVLPWSSAFGYYAVNPCGDPKRDTGGEIAIGKTSTQGPA